MDIKTIKNDWFAIKDRPLRINVKCQEFDKGDDTSNETFLQSWKKFTQETSHHGLRFTCDASTSFVRRSLWSLGVLVSWVFIIYLVVSSAIRAFGTEVKTQIKVETVSPMPFPAVTICNYNQYRKSYFLSTDAYRRAVLISMYPSPLNMFSALTKPYLNALNNQTAPLGFNATELFTAAAHQIEDMTFTCLWEGMEENCTSLFTTVFTDQGVCYTFNADRSRVQTSPGSANALEMMMILGNDEYFASESSRTAGLKVLVHDHDEIPLMKQFGFAISPGAATSVSLSKIVNEDDPVTGCLDTKNEPNSLQFYQTYTYKRCYVECIARCVQDKCNCRLFYQPGNYSICDSPESIKCGKRAAVTCGNSETYRCRDTCPRTCENVRYNWQLSLGRYPDQSTTDILTRFINTTEESFQKNSIKVTIFFEDMSVTKIIQTKAYTTEDISSDVGGQMGLCLGASLITIGEFIDFIVCHFVATVKRCFRKRPGQVQNLHLPDV